MAEQAPDLKIRTSVKFDGSIWRQYETSTHLFVLTSLGRHLLRERHMYKDFVRYTDDYMNDRQGNEDFRSYLAEGANGKVYTLGDDFVVKESRLLTQLAPADSLLAALNRMDQLVDAVQKNCPSWIDVPAHYGIAVSKADTRKQFMLMQKIDHGVTVGDIILADESRISHGILTSEAFNKFGPITPELRTEVNDRYELLKYLVKTAIIKERLNPDVYLPDIDYNPHNVVIEKLATPIAGSQIKYSVIDQ